MAKEKASPRTKKKERKNILNALATFGLFEIALELLFDQPVNPLYFLLFTQLNAVIGKLASVLAVLSGGVVAALDGALIRIATVTLEVELHRLAAAKPALSFSVSSQNVPPEAVEPPFARSLGRAR